MISNDLGQRLHDRRTRGETITSEEGTQLEAWYAFLDQEESEMLSRAAASKSTAELEALVERTATQVVLQAQRIRLLAAENAELRRELAVLQQKMAARLAGKPG